MWPLEEVVTTDRSKRGGECILLKINLTAEKSNGMKLVLLGFNVNIDEP